MANLAEPQLSPVRRVYWPVADAATEFARLIDLGGTPHEKLQEVGGGIKVGSVLDPFGNVFAILENPHFDLSHLR